MKKSSRVLLLTLFIIAGLTLSGCKTTNSTSVVDSLTTTPSIANPTTNGKPTTIIPPSTAAPSTQAPTTKTPTTVVPSTAAPTTIAPSTQAPTTMAPTTVVLSSIAITTQPTKVNYIEGQSFDPTGMVVTATYSDNTTAIVTDYTLSKTTELEVVDTKVTVTYEGKTAEITIIVVAKAVTSIVITMPPINMDYIEGQSFDATGMEVTAIYNDESIAIVTGYTYSSEPLTTDDTEITISYEGKTAEVSITVAVKALMFIGVIPPTKVNYVEGESFDPTDMVVTAIYNDGSRGAVTDYTISKTTALEATDTKITIIYAGETAEVNITVVAKAIASIAITTQPTKVNYIEGQSFDATGMVVTATYNDGSSEVVTDYTMSKTTLALEDTKVLITYADKTEEVNIIVAAKVVASISITTEPTKVAYISGESFDTTGMVVTAIYNDGSSVIITDYEYNTNSLTEDDTKIIISYNDKTAEISISVIAKVVKSIEITARPTDVDYVEGQSFNPSGMVVTATYNDETTAIVTGYTYSSEPLTTETNSITISYGEKVATVNINVVAKEVVSVAVTTKPTKVEYIEGQSFDKTGTVVTATYNDESIVVVTDYTISKTTLALEDTKVTITYAGKTEEVTITVIAKAITSIIITMPPINMDYIEGQSFDATGMEVTAYYNDESTAIVTGYAYSSEPLTTDDTEITISYEEKTTTVPINVVTRALVFIGAFPPTKVNYVEGESFDPTGMVVNAYYNDGSVEAVTDYTISKTTLALEDTEVIITYKGKTEKVTITVTPIRVESVSINISSISIVTGYSQTVVATVLPADAGNKEVTWSSSNDEVATVSSGIITAVSVGTATITCETTDGNKTAEIEVFVLSAEQMPVFISEYGEGSSSNKWIELFNPTDKNISLSGYYLSLYANGASSSNSSLDLSDIIIAPLETYLIVNSSAKTELTSVADLVTGTGTAFSGDDAVALILGDSVIDLIGEIGTDPGSSWTVGSGSTADHTLVRNSEIHQGLNTFTASEWTVYEKDDFTHIGAHEVYYCIYYKDVDGTIIDKRHYSEGDMIVAIEAPIKDGYSFINWIGSIPETMPENNIEVVASWKANTYVITFDFAGGVSSSPTSKNIDYKSKIGDLPIVTKEGYNFVEWKVADDLITSETEWTYLENKTVVAVWVAATDTEYKVEYYLESVDGLSYVKTSEDTKEGTTDTLATTVAKVIDYFTYNSEHASNIKSGTIKGDGSLVLKLYYTRNTYSITYDVAGGDAKEVDYYKYEATLNITNPTKTGCSFDKWLETVPEKMPHENLTLTAFWTVNSYALTVSIEGNGHLNALSANSGNKEYGSSITVVAVEDEGNYFVGWYVNDEQVSTSNSYNFVMPSSNLEIKAKFSEVAQANYSVQYYLEKLDGSYELNEELSEEKRSVAGASVSAELKTIEGFTHNAEHLEKNESGTILVDNSLVLKVYYIRNTHTITYNMNGGVAKASENIKFGTALNITDPTRTGYTFDKWLENVPETMPNEDITLTASWIANTNTQYTVEYYLEDLSGETWTKDNELSGTKTGTTATLINAEIKTISGFTHNADHADAVEEGTIAADGSLVLEVYYTRNTCTITFNTDGGSEVESISGKYESSITAPSDPTKENYTFNGWSTSIPETMPAESITITASWKSNAPAEPVLILNSDFGEFNNTNSNYGTVFTDNVPNGSFDPLPDETSSYTFLGANANGSSWTYLKYGKKNVNATLEALNNYFYMNSSFTSVSKIVLSLSNVVANTSIYVQSSSDKTTWTTETTYLISSAITNQTDVSITGLNIANKYVRIVFTSTTSATSSNGWLLFLYSISYYTGEESAAPELTIGTAYTNDRVQLKVNDEFNLPTVTASDAEDGNLTSFIVSDFSRISAYLVSGTNYKFTAKGNYTITYTVTDSDNKTDSYTLTIIVSETEVVNVDWSGVDWTPGELTYYNSLESSTDQLNDLAYLLRDTITYQTYGDARYIFIEDQDTGYQYVLYDTTKDYPISWGDGGIIDDTHKIDREHIWACNNMWIMVTFDDSHGYGSCSLNETGDNYRPDDNSDSGHYSDLHNLWNAVRYANQTLHSDYFFGGETTSWTDDIIDAPSSTNSIFYPGEEYCGDVARACFYMTLMYPYLTLVNSDSEYGEGSIYYGYLDILLEWNEMDPVSEEEIIRNNLIFAEQGNRNPFIDLYSSDIADLVFANGDPEVVDRQ